MPRVHWVPVLSAMGAIVALGYAVVSAGAAFPVGLGIAALLGIQVAVLKAGRLRALLGTLALLSIACGGGGGGSGGSAPAGPPGPVLDIAPKMASAISGIPLRFTAMVVDPDGSRRSETVTWTSENPGIATINSTGQATGLPGRTGAVVITATLASAPLVRATTLLTVTPPDEELSDILVITPALRSFPWNGGASVERPLGSYVGAGAIPAGPGDYLKGIASAPGGKVYLLGSARLPGEADGVGIWCLNTLAGTHTLSSDVLHYPALGRATSLAVDSRGRLFFAAYGEDMEKDIYMCDPATSPALVPFAKSGATVQGLAIDSEDNLYVLPGLVSGSMVYRMSIPAGGAFTPLMPCPAPSLPVVMAGLAVVGAGETIFVANRNDREIYRSVPGGDVELWCGGFVAIEGIFWTGRALLVNAPDNGARICKVEDLDGNGAISDEEITVWSEGTPISDGGTMSIFARVKP